MIRARIAALVADIEAEAAAHREKTGTPALGPAAIPRPHQDLCHRYRAIPVSDEEKGLPFEETFRRPRGLQ